MTPVARLGHMVKGGGGDPCTRFERENEVREEGGNGSDRLPLSCSSGREDGVWGGEVRLEGHIVSGEGGGRGQRGAWGRGPRLVTKTRPRRPRVAHSASRGCACRGGCTMGRLVVGRPGGRRKWALIN
jgi:hypothetical protein